MHSKTMMLISQLGLPKINGSEFMDNLGMLQFYGVVKLISNPKNKSAIKVFFCK